MIRYAITDPSIYNQQYLKKLNKNADFVLFRHKNTNEYKNLAKEFINSTKNYLFKKLLHQDYKLANELNAYGVHLTSKQFDKIKEAKALGLFVIISTHTIKEVAKAQELGADAVTYSPIFSTPNKGKPKGIKELSNIVNNFDIKIIALGGIISINEVNQIRDANAFGFASIRYFSK